MQIGYPTDVKHLSHIGWDGPSANSPSWLKEFKITPGSPGVLNSVGEVNSPAKSSTKNEFLGIEGSLLPDNTKMHKSLGAPLNSPTRRSTRKTKQSRRHHSSNGSVGLKAQDSSGFTKSRQHKNSLPDLLDRDSSYSPRRQYQKLNVGSDSPYPDPPASPKPSHQTKSKGSSDDSLLRDITKMHKSSGAPLDSPTRCSTSKTKQSRRHHSSNGSVGLKAQDSSGFSKSRQPKNSLPDLLNRDSSYSPRQHQKSNIGLESPYPPTSPKPSHQTKSEGSSDGGVSTNYQDLKVTIH
ncbi:hypothetical protein F0562_000516 [Nyssa sinensis]|uniref:CRIB domain-containing protein n=1 Tax=Nyssa sinensis TaxID=561372 RepID=A0A5J5C4K5_9ASTE|nr:hypothetical protein F0562_000516 [Nyssa sinensis]